MKKTTAYAVILISILYLTACSKSLTPYEAANGSHGRKCLQIR